MVSEKLFGHFIEMMYKNEEARLPLYINTINNYYLELDDIQSKFFRKIMKFFAKGIMDHIDEKHLILSKSEIQYFLESAIRIWKKGGSRKKRKALRSKYLQRLKEASPYKDITETKEEGFAMHCVLLVLDDKPDSAKDRVDYAFVEDYIYHLKQLNVGEDKIQALLEKYFGEVLAEVENEIKNICEWSNAKPSSVQ